MTVRARAASLPLSGKRIVVTRAREQVGRFRRLLEAAGGEVLEIPTIQIAPPESWEPLDSALDQLEQFRWVIFTSVNGVESFRGRLALKGGNPSALRSARVAAIGPATAAALVEWGVEPALVPDEYRAEGLVEHLRPLIRPEERVLLPRAAQTRDLLVRELERLGARVTEVPAYRTLPVREGADTLRRALKAGEVDVLTLTSSSTARSCASMFPERERQALLGDVVVACIGPVTAATVAELGLTAHIVPSEYTIPALVRAIIEYYQQRKGVK